MSLVHSHLSLAKRTKRIFPYWGVGEGYTHFQLQIKHHLWLVDLLEARGRCGNTEGRTWRGGSPAETTGIIASSCVQSGSTVQPPQDPGPHPSPSRLLSGSAAPPSTGCSRPRCPRPTGRVTVGWLHFPSSLSDQHSAPQGLCTPLLKGKVLFSNSYITAKPLCCTHAKRPLGLWALTVPSWSYT